MNATEKIEQILAWVDEGFIIKAVRSFCNELEQEEQEFVFSLLGELRRKIKQQP